MAARQMAVLAAALCALPALVSALSVQGRAGAAQAQTPPDAQERFEELSSGGWDNSSLSGPGSRPELCKPFADFFLRWIGNHRDEVQSMVEVSAGHWPTGWQRFVEWPDIDYTGVDLLDDVVAADKKYLAEHGKGGLRSMAFQQGDMLLDASLPRADLLFTKDTLIHFPNKYIQQFLNNTVLQCPPKYKYVMFVHDSRPRDQANNDINRFGEFHGLQLKNPPFNLKVSTRFKWTASLDGKTRVVQVLRPEKYCGDTPPTVDLDALEAHERERERRRKVRARKAHEAELNAEMPASATDEAEETAKASEPY
mmetsp:Transcript_72288/g.188538  ORF Transcript_72288/g.188538 Transcript_72288/m.188538 type:complete len:310 (+) Transcript_72288:77-1006(+)